MAFGASRRGPATLATGATRASVAAECREAALEFMAGAADGWDKVELARWLTGSYARATRHFRHGERTLVVERAADDAASRGEPGGSRERGSESRERVSADAVEDLLTSTRGRLLAALEKAALSGGALAFAGEIVERGFVRRAFGEDGIDAWLAVDGPRMRLRDRVSALFVADYLNDPAAYAALYVCHHCEAVVFDEGAGRAGMCSAHRRASGIVVRAGADDAARASGDD
ncbi:MAG: hypothetical protein KF764_28970 [Labilithrix sp.]|nr:hypothetical protein [Labilithrix sp.]